MDMGGMGGMAKPAHACKISMLWNWYTVDSCFIARSWHVKSKGAFAGSCIGVFFLVFAAQWLHRFCRELDNAIVARRRQQALNVVDTSSEDSKTKSYPSPLGSSPNPYIYTLSHKWLFFSQPNDLVPSPLEHVLRSVLYTVEWGLSYIIMLLFMYYNGYIIISCILGALFGKLAFSYNEPLTCNDDEDRKCCK
ncbi:Ctr copper transporter [Suhomyces tanzawaensis NRRL Y-17324]|uniref:Copper transport protein n=1 Tax=Suhomyces tanzawaensis NRRL Y-17324 TaxID=984487 RepID=A0A1E4SB28_9ASCO|nr:Ctr copper transporter [Suhomyces tanzawaensis NRRL Y-17324]ODV76709.1 Ctr copper transporter [Suhomyces tanzawaensis NRRL Y-17324]